MPKGENSFDFTFISRDKLEPQILDSIPNRQVETLSSKDREIRKYVLEGKTAFSAQVDSINILSSSLELLEKVLSQDIPQDPDLKMAFKAASPKKTSVFINHKEASPFLDELFPSTFFQLQQLDCAGHRYFSNRNCP